MNKKKSIDELFTEVDSRYALVNAVAQKAREIADDKERSAGVEKPVLLVLDELRTGAAKIVNIEDLPKPVQSEELELSDEEFFTDED